MTLKCCGLAGHLRQIFLVELVWLSDFSLWPRRLETSVACLGLLFLLLGCQSGAAIPAPTYIGASLRAGVLQDSPGIPQARAYLQQIGVQNTFQHPMDQLQEQLETGNLDIVYGLPLTDGLLNTRLWSTRPIEVRAYRFYVAADHPKKLNRYTFYSSLRNQVKRIGYESQGIHAILTPLMLEQSDDRELYAPCGAMADCVVQLKAGSIDAVFADESSFAEIGSLDASYVAPSKVKHMQPFGFYINQRTMSPQEYSKVQAMLGR